MSTVSRRILGGMGGSYEELDHTADWALRLQGRNMAELCLLGASGMLAACGARAGAGTPSERRITLQAGKREILLVRWLQEVLYAVEVHQVLPQRIEVEVPEDLTLSARWLEVPLGGIEKPIKAVTYSGLEVRELNGGLEATIVFDV